MRIVWVTSNVWYSYLLRWLFNAKTSHVGSIFDNRVVIDINNPVGKAYTLRAWLTHYNIIEQVEYLLPADQEMQLYERVKAYAVGRQYDIKGYYWGMFCGLVNKLFWIPLPKKNAFSEEGKDMCQEIIRPVVTDPAINLAIDLSKLNAMTPDMSMNHVREATKGRPDFVWQNLES